MSDERKKINKISTGTVPKVQYRNNSYLTNEQDLPRSLTNNMVGYWHHSPDTVIRNPRRSDINYLFMDTALEDTLPVQGDVVSLDHQVNGLATPNVSFSTSRRSSISRRNSGSTLKCDNVTKYPDKKQIEEKLQQIREYLKITNSLMISMKNTDEQITDKAEKGNLEKMINDLKDSENKLINILDQFNSSETEEGSKVQAVDNGIDNMSEDSNSSCRKNEPELNIDYPNHELDVVIDQQLALLRLQHKAENKLKDRRETQSKLLCASQHDDIKTISNHKDKNCSEHDFDAAVKELEERAGRLRPSCSSNQKFQDNILAKVESLHNQIIGMHNANDEREQLIEALDNRDAELQTQHAELQSKLMELQNKKLQVDQLTTQLQNFGHEEENDIGDQVKTIVTMKDQLKKLKDMLDIVKTTENIMEKENTNASAMAQASSCDIRLLSENFMDKDMQKPPVQNDNNVLRHDNTTDNQPKEVNKKTRYESSKGVKSKSPTIKEKLALQVELEAKKKELEAIMGKHKASTSNLNHDIGVDGKSEFSCTSNAINEAWIPLISPQNNYADSDRFSNGECPDDVNGYSELQDNPNILSSNTSKYRSEIHPRGDYSPSEFDRLQNLYPTSQRNVKSSYVATSSCIREPRTNSEEDDRTKVQKQLQLIKSVCDSMLEEQTANISPNVQHMQNNLIPSYFSEPHRFILPNQHTLNTLNFINSTGDMPCFSRNTNLNLDISNYQNWLATNTIQTQSFMLNTLNQCCQMLWLQQRELTSLKTAVTMLQERVENIPFGGAQERIPSSLHTTPQDHRVGSHYRPVPNPKVNQVSSAFSLPNLNNYNVPSSNLELNYNQNNIHGGRLLDPSLNNINVNHLNPHQGIEHANNLLHGVNSNINTVPNQMWNGQALNNQVTPGNRSNNYWANFRR